ncbi:uncharacterized protein EV420DRAFT_1152681 [Desarmillaria tabescens]|uniref:F-box domain-containing protein n=1 Tax=Armillaria tabescens TaxID=1929756 RepID=A0AA39NCH1_ARMTA|nr:uncharacterized protein EV420DRAFT_1152681 [Desarmillaria tabescens]KAK0463056.1 hypothetical protein EV420DRAFT_1152681 [Desarmillaria tabescens]
MPKSSPITQSQSARPSPYSRPKDATPSEPPKTKGWTGPCKDLYKALSQESPQARKLARRCEKLRKRCCRIVGPVDDNYKPVIDPQPFFLEQHLTSRTIGVLVQKSEENPSKTLLLTSVTHRDWLEVRDTCPSANLLFGPRPRQWPVHDIKSAEFHDCEIDAVLAHLTCPQIHRAVISGNCDSSSDIESVSATSSIRALKLSSCTDIPTLLRLLEMPFLRHLALEVNVASYGISEIQSRVTEFNRLPSLASHRLHSLVLSKMPFDDLTLMRVLTELPTLTRLVVHEASDKLDGYDGYMLSRSVLRDLTRVPRLTDYSRRYPMLPRLKDLELVWSSGYHWRDGEGPEGPHTESMYLVQNMIAYEGFVTEMIESRCFRPEGDKGRQLQRLESVAVGCRQLFGTDKMDVITAPTREYLDALPARCRKNDQEYEISVTIIVPT